MLHLWYTHFVKSVTSSIRISAELRAQLEEVAQQLQSGKNRIITQALEEFLAKVSRERFLAEARRQSILASAADEGEDEFWAQAADTSGWK